MIHRTHTLVIALLGVAFSLATWHHPAEAESASDYRPARTIRGYRLYPLDRISINVFGQEDLSIEQRLNSNGQIFIPLLGNISISGLTDVQAREKIEQALKDNDLLVNPQVILTIMEYAPRFVTVLGQVKNPGQIAYPLESESLDIVTVLAMAGDFTGTAKSSEVLVTRQDEKGIKQTLTIDVDRLIGSSVKKESFAVLPNDVIFVPQRLF